MKATLIHNPGAGDPKNPSVGQIEALMKEAGYKVRCRSTGEKGWKKALRKSADLVVVAGGDGTVGKVARRMVGTGVPIGILPLGTANNISRTLGIRDLPITQLIPAWRSAVHVHFDVGVASGPWGERYFIEGIGTGLLSGAMPHVDENRTAKQLEDAEVKVTYAQQILRDRLADCPAIAIDARLDGEDISGRYLLFEALVMQFIGPNLFLGPDVERNDGRMDVVMIREEDRERACRHIRTWQDGKPWPGEFATRRGERLQMEWTGYTLHIDDRLWPREGKGRGRAESPATIDARVIRNGIGFLVPGDLPASGVMG